MLQHPHRPKFLNLLKIHLPVTGIVSILHRVAGALLFLAVPGLIYLFNVSLDSAASFHAIGAWLSTPGTKIIVTLFAWALLHHLLGGIRFLLTDIGIGMELRPARASAWLVNILSGLGFVVLVVELWL
ncbi:MAG: succinate dehydrogenase, cytochrome b556 subunit [Gammaproteobacteria bacterium]|nr:succinate dehydrogenase, cytochrome b556 subunit [Gammaproteobacteria bacterium]